MTTSILNITYQGLSADYPLDTDMRLADRDVRRIAIEVVRSGGIRGIVEPHLHESAFNDFVVDRFTQNDGRQRIYLRPKVPFGGTG